MSLIEQAANMGEQRVKRRAGGGPRLRPQAPVKAAPAREPALFTLDKKMMVRQGFVHPEHLEPRLGLELRSVKRRLLRRLGFYKLDREKARKARGNARQRNTVLVTSTRPNEGKTFTALNLALSLAIEDEIDVLLIDADIPRPKVFSHLGLEAGEGVTDRLADLARPVEDFLLKEKDLPFSVMAPGTQDERGTDVFATKAMADFIRELSAQNPDRLIIFDAPPVLATPDAGLLARHVDEVAFVIEANKTPEPAAAAALDELLDCNERVSLILNKCLVSESASEYGSYEDYYQDKSGGAARRKAAEGKT